MSITAAELVAKVVVQGAQEAAAKLGEVGASAEGAGSKLKTLAIGGIVIAGAALAAVGVESVKMAADFQQATLSLVAHAGLAKDQVNNVTHAVLAMAPTVGRSPIELADALYPILSAFSGITNQSAKTTLSLSTLKMAFETVAGTTVDGTAVANAAVGTFNALGLATNNAGINAKRMATVFDVMDKTVQLGNMTWDQFKNVIAKVATSANTAHVSFNEASAALATLTSQGVNVQKAGTYLVNTFNTLEIKTDSLAKHAKKLHLAFNESKYASMDLADKIKYLSDITGGNSQKLLALMGNNSTALQTFEKLATGVNTYRADLDALNHSQGALKSSFDTAAEGFNFHAQQLKAAFDVLFINIGTQLLPVLGKLMDQLTPLVAQFSDWIVTSGTLDQVTQGLQSTISITTSTIQETIGVTQQVIGFYQQWQFPINSVALSLSVFFIPALIKSGVEAVISAGKITYSFVASLIAAGIQGWAAGVKLMVLVASFIATQIEATAAAAVIAGQFVFSLLKVAVQGGLTALVLNASLSPSILGVAADAILAATTAIPALIAGFGTAATAAWALAVAVTAVFWPIMVAIGAIALIVVAITHWGDITTGFSKLWSQLMNNVSQSTHQAATGVATSMENAESRTKVSVDNISYDVEASTGRIIHATKQAQVDTTDNFRNITIAGQTMAARLLDAMGNVAYKGGQSFAQLLSQVDMDMSQIDANAKQYWADVMGYIEHNPIVGHVTYTTAGGGLGVQQGATTGHNAMGTNFWQGGMTWVGERGPEIINLPRGSQVIPNHQINNVVGSSGSSGQPIQVNINLAGHRVAQVLLPELVQAIRNKTGARI